VSKDMPVSSGRIDSVQVTLIMEDFLFVVGFFVLVRIVFLSTERVALHGLGRGNQNALATMAIAFWGASLILWLVALSQHQLLWVGDAIWIGLIYALAFGLYTAALAEGPIGAVSAWTNLTIILLWLLNPSDSGVAWCGIALFTAGGIWLAGRQFSRSIIWIILSDLLFVMARTLDSHHTHFPTYAYAASLFTSISSWMAVAIVSGGAVTSVLPLFWARPGWSLAAALTNAGAYLSLFMLLHWLPPSLVEAVSAFAAFVATAAGVVWFHESNAVRKLGASMLMTIGVLVLLVNHYLSLQGLLH